MLRKVFVALVLAPLSVFGANFNESPKFKDFPAGAPFTGSGVPAQISSDAEKTYRTRLRAAASEPANFAGDHVISTWGCGTGCLFGAAVSLKTGKVTFLPGTVCCWNGPGERLEFRSTSRLLVAAGLIDETGAYGAHFYEFTGQSFRFIKTISLSENHTENPQRPTQPTIEDKWPTLAETNSDLWQIQPGSLETTKNKGGTQIIVTTGKITNKISRQITLRRFYVSIGDCRRKQGKLVSLSIENEYQYENEFLMGSGSVASTLAEGICSAGLKFLRESNSKGI